MVARRWVWLVAAGTALSGCGDGESSGDPNGNGNSTDNANGNANGNGNGNENTNENSNSNENANTPGSVAVTLELDTTLLDSADFAGDVGAAIAAYVVDGEGPGPSFNQRVVEPTVSVSDLDPGTWTLTVDALDGADAVVASGAAMVEVLGDEEASLTVLVAPLQSGSGALDLLITWPPGAVSAVDNATLTEVGGEGVGLNVAGELAEEEGGVSLSRALASGTYTFEVEASVSGVVVADEVRTVVVTDDVTTPGTLALDSLAPDPGFGDIRGACRIIDSTLLADPTPRLIRNTIDFGTDPFDSGDSALLTPGGQEILADSSGGGTGVNAEIFAHEVLARCESATLLKTEDEIVYDDGLSPKVDYSVQSAGQTLGVSVSRVFSFMSEVVSVSDCQARIENVLDDAIAATASVNEDDAWVRPIIHLMVELPESADNCGLAWDAISGTRKQDAWVWLTLTRGDDSPLY